MVNKALRIVLVLLLLAALPVTVMAQEFDPNQQGSISVSLKSKETKTPLEGADLSLFHVADVQMGSDGILRFSPVGDFADSGISLDDPDLTAKLDAYVTEHTISCWTATTDADGGARWEDLTLGLYFVKQTNQVHGFAPCSPFLVSIPFSTDTGFEYHVDASPKTDVARLIDITIRKVWNTGESTPIPDQVTVQLFRHETLVNTAVLNDENNWQVTYLDQPESDGYRIVEVKVPQGFTASYSRSGYVFTVTNTPSLAQTGQLVWPIPIFATAGFFFLIVGFILVRKPGKKNA